MTVLDLGSAPTAPSSGAERLGQYLRARRALALPTQARLSRPTDGPGTGLRPQEVAQLAGISPEHYERLERGDGERPSDRMLAALARALQLDGHATAYLLRLGRDDLQDPAVSAADLDPVALLAPWAGAPAFVLDATRDVIAANRPAELLGGGLFAAGGNVLLRLYSRGADRIGPSWDALVESHVAAMRFHAPPGDARLHEVVGELSMHSAHFRRLWTRHDARPDVGGRFTTEVEPVGRFELGYQSLDLPAHPGCSLVACYAPPGSAAEPALAFVMAVGA